MLRLVSFILIPALVIGAVIALEGLQGALHSPLALSKPRALEVPGGSSLNRVLVDLQRHGLIQSVLPLKIYARVYGRGAIQAGRYELSPGISSLQLLDMLERGEVKAYKVGFPEGLTTREWFGRLHSAGYLSEKEKLEMGYLVEALSLPRGSPEGWFAPDTYTYRSGDTALSILRQANARMREELERLWVARDPQLPYRSAYEALIMASIIEKETGDPREREAIAGVFVRRLQRGMRLQTDPTVIYGLGEAYKGNLTRKHLRTKTPYNTYRIDGLPPTPIANPGLAALRAAFHPLAGEALYFVAKGDGSHYFSATLAEHQRAVRHYQIEKRRGDYRSSPSN